MRISDWSSDVCSSDLAEAAGEMLAAKGFDFDLTFTSVQTRAIRTLNIALEKMGRLWLPTEKDWRLNERHYGGLTGLNNAKTAERHGDEPVHNWPRSFDTAQPPSAAGTADDPDHAPPPPGDSPPGTTAPADNN